MKKINKIDPQIFLSLSQFSVLLSLPLFSRNEVGHETAGGKVWRPSVGGGRGGGGRGAIDDARRSGNLGIPSSIMDKHQSVLGFFPLNCVRLLFFERHIIEVLMKNPVKYVFIR